MAAAKAKPNGARAAATSTRSRNAIPTSSCRWRVSPAPPTESSAASTLAGANYKKGDFSIGAIDYYSDDIINIFYTESKFALPLSDDLRLQFALQYSDQQSTGDNLLRGADFASQQWGGKAELGVGGALFSAAYTSAGGDTDKQAPWGSYPGYTSVQIEDFNRDGEDAWMLRAAYNFPSVKGLSLYGLWVNGSDPQDPRAVRQGRIRPQPAVDARQRPPQGVDDAVAVCTRVTGRSRELRSGRPARDDLLRPGIALNPSLKRTGPGRAYAAGAIAGVAPRRRARSDSSAAMASQAYKARATNRLKRIAKPR